MTDRSSQSYPPNSEQETGTLSAGVSKTFTIKINRQTSSEDNNHQEGSLSNKSKSETTKLKSMDSKKIKSSDKQSVSLSNIGADKKASKLMINTFDYPISHKPAVMHALFDPNRERLDPARPLTDFPDPAPLNIRQTNKLMEVFEEFHKEEVDSYQEIINKKIRLLDQAFMDDIGKYGEKLKDDNFNFNNFDQGTSKWELIQSPDLKEHIELLQAGGLVKFPTSFYKNSSVQPLLSTLEEMKLVDTSQIVFSIKELNTEFRQQGELTKQGFVNSLKLEKELTKQQTNLSNSFSIFDDTHSLQSVSEWESVLYPHRFDKNRVVYGSLETDIMAVSVVKHALAQCPIRQSINEKLTARDISKYLRAYLLSQCNQLPNRRAGLKNIHIYPGHVLVVAQMLGWQIKIIEEGKSVGDVFFNVSSRCGLFTRYPVLDDYYINGWM